MKRLLILPLMLAALVAVPSSALATPFNIQRNGYGLRSADLEAYTLQEWYGAPAGPFHIRAAIDKCHGDPVAHYAGKLNDFASRGVHVLPILTWSSSCYGPKVKIDTWSETLDWQNFAQRVAVLFNFVEGTDGLPQTNLYEIWNEPNSDNATAEGSYSEPDYFNWVYNSARIGIRNQDPDAGTIFGGLCFGNGTGGGSCHSDAKTYINHAVNNGHTGINGFGIHPYGRTAADMTYVGAQSAQRMFDEYLRACSAITRVANRSVFMTESGRPGNNTASGENAEATWLVNMTSEPARVVTNWIGEDQSLTGTGSMGVIRYNGGGPKEPPWTTWVNAAQPAYSGDTNGPTGC